MKVNPDKEIINYTFDDYRNEIRIILKRNNKRIKICKVLKECGISKGNYYVFMNGGREYKTGTVSTLSYAKLDRLLSMLRSADTYSTNRERLMSMTNEELAKCIENIFIDDPNANQIDVLKWLNSTNTKMIYRNTKIKKDD